MKETQVEQRKEKQFLDVLCRDYTSVYYLDLRSDTFEMVKLDQQANASRIDEMRQQGVMCYSDMVRRYCDQYVIESQKKEFLHNLSISHLTEMLKTRERITFRYQSIPNLMGEQFFEAQVVRLSEQQFDYKVLLGFRHVDDLVAEEQRHQKELEQALEQVRLSNEVLSAIGKIYYAIFRIDLEQDFYEEISSDSEVHHLTGKTGCASTELVELCNTFVVPTYRERIMEFMDLSTLADRLENEETIAAEYLATDGNWHTVRFIVKRRNSKGRVTHVLYVTRLISDTKRREQNWIAIAEEANQANAAKTEFISQIAHDIRTPMNAIMGFVSITEAHMQDPEQVVYGLEKIRMAGEFLQQLVDEVLDISKIENGQMELRPREFDVTKMIQDFCDAYDHMQHGKQLAFIYRVHDILYKDLIADDLRLRQIYSNIMSNAIKYTPDNGKISFELYEKPAEEGKVQLIAVISDTGIGMSEEYMSKMYSKFTREVDTRINKVRGYGLGLSIVKELTDLMSGQIDVKSVQGKGTTFQVTFEFPYVNAAQKLVQTEKPVDDGVKCQGMHVLVAEDNELNYEVAKELLGLHGITCDWAENGAVCVEMIRAAKPDAYDAILMDMQMPIMGGLQATEMIRNLNVAEAHRIPIIAMTANAFPEDVQKCLDAGMNAYLSKPINMDKLLKVLAEYRKM